MVMASDWGETWGLSANEALASGVPVILSDRCGCAEDLSFATKEARVFQIGNVKQLAELIGDGRWKMGDGPTSLQASRTREELRRVESEGSGRRELMRVMREKFDAKNTIATVKRLLV
jgi:glycosyltransferase involved in cell wall biosynthesis